MPIAPARPSRAPLIVAIAVAVIALAVAIGSWFRPIPEPTPVAAPTYTDSEVADAKKQVCDAYGHAHDAIFTAGNTKDPANSLTYAVNARLSFFAGAQYLDDTLDSQPATPSELAGAAKQYSSTYRLLALGLLADKSAEQIGQPLLDAGDAANEKLKQLCQ
jgi:hypothetical protein